MKKAICISIVAIMVLSGIALAAPDKDGIERIDVLHYGRGKDFAKGQGPAQKPTSAACYKAQYRSAQGTGFTLNVDNPYGLTQAFLSSGMAAASSEWDSHTGAQLYGAIAYDTESHYDPSHRDGVNAIDFGYYGNPGVIAVTSFWVNTKTKAIIEWDMRFNTASSWAWGDAGVNPALMDFQDIATHELGHTLGLGDLYTGGCAAVTMYGYSSEGETSKRSIEAADIAGLQKIYGQ